VADLSITLLRPGAPGQALADIDNRLKTLVDALKVPKKQGELPPDAVPSEDEDPFFCLLEDDKLLTAIRVETDQLLVPAEESEVVVLIQVRTRIIRPTLGGLALT